MKTLGKLATEEQIKSTVATPKDITTAQILTYAITGITAIRKNRSDVENIQTRNGRPGKATNLPTGITIQGVNATLPMIGVAGTLKSESTITVALRHGLMKTGTDLTTTRQPIRV